MSLFALLFIVSGFGGIGVSYWVVAEKAAWAHVALFILFAVFAYSFKQILSEMPPATFL